VIPLFAHTPDTLHAELPGVPLAACRRAFHDLVGKGLPAMETRDGLSKASIRAIEAACHWALPEVETRVQDDFDKSVRYLFRLADGARVEAVCIPLHKPGRYSVCLSSQVGCAMGCAFCATGRLGLARNLATEEIIGCFLRVRSECPGRVSGAVFMGQGEPFHNYDAVLRAAEILCHPNGGAIAAENVTISTVGVVPAIHRYAAERRSFRLIISLHSAIQSRRDALVAVSRKWPLPALAEAIRAYAQVAPGRVTVAYTLVSGVNTGADEAEALAALLGDLPLRINLIDVNDTTGEFAQAPDAERRRFMDLLQPLRVPIVRRYSVGAAQNSACGMLASVTP